MNADGKGTWIEFARDGSIWRRKLQSVLGSCLNGKDIIFLCHNGFGAYIEVSIDELRKALIIRKHEKRRKDGHG